MKLLILGGTGFVGTALKGHFERQNDQVVVLGRKAFDADFDLPAALNEVDVLIMLAGENVGKRWTKKHKQAMWDSRIENNKKLALALKACESPPTKILAASAIGIYPESHQEKVWSDIEPLQVGSGFLAELGQAWETKLNELSPTPTIFRFGVVLGKGGGALQKMLLPFQLGLGGPVAGGKQLFTWVHIEDLCRAFSYAIAHDLKGVYNLTAPEVVSNRVFGQTLAKQLHRPFFLPLPAWQLKLIFGEGAQVLMSSLNIRSDKLPHAGFEFEFPTVEKALADILDE